MGRLSETRRARAVSGALDGALFFLYNYWESWIVPLERVYFMDDGDPGGGRMNRYF